MKFTNKIISNIIFSTSAIFILYGFLFVNTADALTISPARIEIKGEAGTTITKEITLLNDSKNGSETYYVSYANFEAQGETGSPKFVEPKNDLGTWMDAGNSVTIEAGKSKTIPLIINIPKDAYAGGHFAVVFFGNSPDTKDGGQVSVGAKTGTLVLLSVDGDVLEAGGLSSFGTETYTKKNGEQAHKLFYNSLPVKFQYRWKNDGNDRVKPEGNITIHNIVYWPTAKINANAVSGNILPHSTRLFDVEWIKSPLDSKEKIPNSFIESYFSKVSYQWKNFAVGPYIANLDLSYGSLGANSSKYAFFFVFPWQLLVVILIVLIVVFFIGRNIIKKYNRYIIKMAQMGIQSPNEAKND